ncbi:hypothetical protein HDV01_002974 [Terramyces sp. JEL0728]|nr:hypothetical protein HDV01_002974 [Terramyces sp. JEL0728]
MLLIPILLNLVLAVSIDKLHGGRSLNKRFFGIGHRIFDGIQQAIGANNDSSSSGNDDSGDDGSSDDGSSGSDDSNTSDNSASSGTANTNVNNNPPAAVPKVVAPKITPLPRPIVTTTLQSVTTTTSSIAANPTFNNKANNLPDDGQATSSPATTTVQAVQPTAYIVPSTQPTIASQASASNSSTTSNGLPRPVTIVAFIIGGVFASCIALFLGLHLKKYGHLDFLHKYYPQDPTSSEKDLTLQSVEEPIDIISDPIDKIPFETREDINRYSEQDMDESFPAFPATALTAAEPDLAAPRMSYLITPSVRTSTLPYSGRDSKLTFSRNSAQERDPKLYSLRNSQGRQSIQSSMGRKSKFMVDDTIPEDLTANETPTTATPYRISMFNSRFSRFSFRTSKYTSGAISEVNSNQRESTVSVDSEESLSNYL